MKSLIVLGIAALVGMTPSCIAPKDNPNQATTKMSVLHGEGPPRADITPEAAPFLVALAAAALDFGIASLKRTTIEAAATYEIKTRAASVARFGVTLPQSYFDPLELGRADVFVVARAIEMHSPGKTDGLILLPAKAGKDSSQWISTMPLPLRGFLDDLDSRLEGPEDGAWSRTKVNIAEMRSLVEATLYDLAPRKLKDGRVSVVSMVAVIDADAPKGSKKDDSASSYQLALRCYSYPLAMEKQGSPALPPNKIPSVASVLTFLVEGPKGYKDVDRFPEYLHEVSFQLKPDAARKAAPGSWQVPEEGSGWVARSDALGAPPYSPYVTTRVQLLETNDVKRSLERLGEFLGGIKLKPTDVGIN